MCSFRLLNYFLYNQASAFLIASTGEFALPNIRERTKPMPPPSAAIYIGSSYKLMGACCAAPLPSGSCIPKPRARHGHSNVGMDDRVVCDEAKLVIAANSIGVDVFKPLGAQQVPSGYPDSEPGQVSRLRVRQLLTCLFCPKRKPPTWYTAYTA